MIEHPAPTYQLRLPGGVQLIIVVGLSGYRRADDMCTVSQCPVDGLGIAVRNGQGEVAGLRWRVKPQQVAHRHTTLKDGIGTAQGIVGEGLEDHLAVGVAHVYLPFHIKRLRLGRPSDDVPSLKVEDVVDALLHVLGIQMRLLELQIDTWAVSCILWVGNISSGKVIFEEIHIDVFVCPLVGNRLPYLAQRLPLVFGLDSVG